MQGTATPHQKGSLKKRKQRRKQSAPDGRESKAAAAISADQDDSDVEPYPAGRAFMTQSTTGKEQSAEVCTSTPALPDTSGTTEKGLQTHHNTQQRHLSINPAWQLL